MRWGVLLLVFTVVVAWLFISSTKNVVSRPGNALADIVPHTKRHMEIRHLDAIDPKFYDLIISNETSLTSNYSYSIIDTYYVNKHIEYYETKDYDGDPLVFYTYDTECVRDLFRRSGYMANTAKRFCYDARYALHAWLPSVVDACYNKIAWPLANDKDAYRMGTDGWGHELRLNIEKCRLYYPDAPLSKKFKISGKRLGDARYQELSQ